MRLTIMLMSLLVISMPVLSQQEIQRSSSPQGVQVHGNSELKGHQESASAVAVGEGNTAKNTTSAIKGGTQIQGTTRIQAEQKNATSTAVGKNNAAKNEVGVIGGK